jgi:hypothetical protein
MIYKALYIRRKRIGASELRSYTVKKVMIFPSPAGMSPTKLSQAGKN